MPFDDAEQLVVLEHQIFNLRKELKCKDRIKNSCDEQVLDASVAQIQDLFVLVVVGDDERPHMGSESHFVVGELIPMMRENSHRFGLTWYDAVDRLFPRTKHKCIGKPFSFHVQGMIGCVPMVVWPLSADVCAQLQTSRRSTTTPGTS